MSEVDVGATHRCGDCKTDLTLLWDDRNDTETSPVCGECGGTNVHRIATDGGRDTHHPTPRAPDYQFGGRQAELTHGARELQQYRIARDAGHLTETEYQTARERIKNTYGIQPQGRTHASP